MRTTLYIGGNRIDLSQDIDIRTNYSLEEIENPTNRSSDFSRTITIPSTPNNNATFGFIAEFDTYVSTFNPTTVYSAVVQQDGIETFVGIAQLLKVSFNGRTYEYEVSLFGQTADLYKSLGQTLLTDLDFSDLNQIWNATNVEASWDLIGDGESVVYPAIDYGQGGYERNWSSPASFLTTTDMFYPAIPLLVYVNKIFEHAGFTYTCDEFETDLFKHIYVPYGISGIPYITEDYYYLFLYKIRLLNQNPTPRNTYPDTTSQILELGYDTSPYVNGGNYDIGTYRFTAPNDCTLNVQFRTTAQADNSVFLVPFNVTFKLLKNGAYYADFFAFTWTTVGFTQTRSAVIPNVDLVAGDYLEVLIDVSGAPATRNVYLFHQSTFWMNQLVGVPQMTIGAEWNMNDTIVPQVKCTDVLTDLIEMYNLMVVPDKNRPKHLNIIPWKDFYTNDFVDWTNKFDEKRGFEIIPAGFYNTKKYLFEFRNGGSFYEKRYAGTYGNNYGARLYFSNNDFSEGENVKTLTSGIGIPTGSYGSSRIYPRFYDVDENGNVKPVAPNFRLVFLKKVVYQNDGDELGVFAFNGNPLPYYPYAGTLDDPYEPTFDLTFGIPRELYYATTPVNNTLFDYTNANLFNVYWKRYIEEMTDQDAKKLIAYFTLTPVDVQNLDYRKYVYIGNTLWRIFSITDYNSVVDESVKVELIRVLPQTPFIPEVFDLTGGTGKKIGDETAPLLDLNIEP